MEQLTLLDSKTFSLRPDRQEVFSWLRCGEGHPCFPAFNAAWDAALSAADAARPRGILYREQNQTLTVFVTLGQEAENNVSRLFARGEYVLGSLLNVLCDELLFQAEHQLGERLCALLAEEHLYIAGRLEPGIDLPLPELRARFARIAPCCPDVRLSEHGVFFPAKSMLYAVTLSAHPCGSDKLHDCSRCPQMDCLYRRAEARL